MIIVEDSTIIIVGFSKDIYNVLIWISLVMLANEGSADPENIFTQESIERLQVLKELVEEKQMSVS